MRKLVVAMVALAIPFAGAGPASADPARASAASAFGITIALGGSELIPPTPAVAVQQPPDAERQEQRVLPLDVGALALNGTVNAVAGATRDSRLIPAITDRGVKRLPATGVNARGFASAENVDVLLQADSGLPVELPQLSLVRADAIEAEAVATCVNNRPVFDFAFNLAEVFIGGTALGVGNLLSPVINLLGPTGVLAAVITFSTPENDPANTVRVTGDRIIVDALRVRLLPLTGGNPLAEVVIGHAEAAMPADCAVARPAPEPTGDGPIAPTLAATGGSDLMLPAALGLLATGFGLYRLNRRSRRANASA